MKFGNRIVLLGLTCAAAFCLPGCVAVSVPSPTDGVGPQRAVSAPALNASFGQMLNAERARAGLPAVSANGVLEQVAEGHARDMEQRNFFSHTSSDGRNVGQRARGVGYGYCFIAENIAQGQDSVTEVHQAWMGSAGHRANNLSDRVTEYGLAKVDDTWVLVLASGGC